MQDSFSAARSNVYKEILGPELYSKLTARRRGHIFFYAKRHRRGEVSLLEAIRDGKITIDAIEADPLRWRQTERR